MADAKLLERSIEVGFRQAIEEWRQRSLVIDLSGADLSPEKLRGKQRAEFESNRADFAHCDFRNANLCGALLRRAKFYGGQHAGACYDRVDLSNMRAADTQFDGASFVGANLEGAYIKHSSFCNVKFHCARITNGMVAGTFFDGSDLRTTDLRGTCLSESDFADALLDFGNEENCAGFFYNACLSNEQRLQYLQKLDQFILRPHMMARRSK